MSWNGFCSLVIAVGALVLVVAVVGPIPEVVHYRGWVATLGVLLMCAGAFGMRCPAGPSS